MTPRNQTAGPALASQPRSDRRIARPTAEAMARMPRSEHERSSFSPPPGPSTIERLSAWAIVASAVIALLVVTLTDVR